MGKHKAKKPATEEVALDFSLTHLVENGEKRLKKEVLEGPSNLTEEHLGNDITKVADDTKKLRHDRNQRTFTTGRYHAIKFLNYDEYLRMIKNDPKCGLTAIKEVNHLTLPYHILNGNGVAGARYIFERSIGKYKRSVNGIVFAIGDIQLIGKLTVIDEQPVFHADFQVELVVFRPGKCRGIRATVQHISKKFVSLTYMNALQVKSFVTPQKQTQLFGCQLEINDEVYVALSGAEVRGGLCQLIGRIHKVLQKQSIGNFSKMNTLSKRRSLVDEEQPKESLETVKAKKPHGKRALASIDSTEREHLIPKIESKLEEDINNQATVIADVMSRKRKRRDDPLSSLEIANTPESLPRKKSKKERDQ